MKKYTDHELNKILDELKTGAVYMGISNGHGMGNIAIRPFSMFISWNHYGSSAEKISMDGLRFIIENIFNDCDIITPAIYSKYHLNYIPANPAFKGVDLSWMHPNVYGL